MSTRNTDNGATPSLSDLGVMSMRDLGPFYDMPRHIRDAGASFTPEQMDQLWDAIDHYSKTGDGADYINSKGQLAHGINHVDPATGLWAPSEAAGA